MRDGEGGERVGEREGRETNRQQEPDRSSVDLDMGKKLRVWERRERNQVGILGRHIEVKEVRTLVKHTQTREVGPVEVLEEERLAVESEDGDVFTTDGGGHEEEMR